MPFALKHFFRGSFSLDKMEKAEKDDPLLTEVINDMRELKKSGNLNPIDNLMFLLMIKLKHLKGDITVVHGKWDALYGPYGAIATAAGYDTPVLFSYVLTTALIIYITMLPIGYSEHSGWNVGITFVIMYFFVGLNYLVSISSQSPSFIVSVVKLELAIFCCLSCKYKLLTDA